MRVKEMMSSPVRTVSSDKSVLHAAGLMEELKIGSLAVTEHISITGIITSRDTRKAHPNRIVADAMTPDPITVPAECFCWEALQIMENNGIERLLVTEKDQVVGIITRDTIRVRLGEQLDPLTGLFRPGYIQTIVEELLQNGQYFQLLFADLNNFGKINKIYGHPIGDDVIRGFAERIRSMTTPDEFICRYAGDEFVIVSLKTEAEIVKLVQKLSDPFVVSGVPVTSAVGVVLGIHEPAFFSLSFREIVSKASLASSTLKKAQPLGEKFANFSKN